MIHRRAVTALAVALLALETIGMVPSLSCSADLPQDRSEADQLTNRLVQAYKHDPRAFASEIRGETVTFRGKAAYTDENGQLAFSVGMWVWDDDLRCVFESNAALLRASRGGVFTVVGVVDYVSPPYLGSGHRVYLVDCTLVSQISQAP